MPPRGRRDRTPGGAARGCRRAFHLTRPGRQQLDQSKLAGIREAHEIGSGERRRAGIEARERGRRVAHHRAHPRVGVLHVEHRVVLRLLGDRARSNSSGASFLRVSIMKRTTSLPTSSTTSRSVTKLPERLDILAGAPWRISLTIWQSLTSSSDCAVGQRRHGRLHALDVTPVVGAPDVDQGVRAAFDLVEMVGDVGGEVGPTSVRFADRPSRRRRRTRSNGTAFVCGAPSPRAACPWADRARLYRSGPGIRASPARRRACPTRPAPAPR